MIKKYIAAALHRSRILRWVLRALIFFLAWFVLHCAMISLDGLTDTDSTETPADAAVVLGNEVYLDGTVCPILDGRLNRTLELYKNGAARHIICSGGKGPGTIWEADVMRDWLVAHGVDRSVILTDYCGKDSFGTAAGARNILDTQGWHSALIVSHFTHISRCKLAFWRHDISAPRTAHAAFHWMDFRSFPHEFAGFYYYLVKRHERCGE